MPVSSSAARMAARNAGNDHVKDGDDAGDDGLEDCADAIDDGHQAAADCAQDGLDLFQYTCQYTISSGILSLLRGRKEGKGMDDVRKIQQHPC